MWSWPLWDPWKKSNAQDAAKKKEASDTLSLAVNSAENVLALARGHLKSVVDTTNDHLQLSDVISKTEDRLKDFGQQIDEADLRLAVTRKKVAEDFDSLSATFTALCEKVKKGNLPTTALATDEAQTAAALQGMNTSKPAPATAPAVVQPKTP